MSKQRIHLGKHGEDAASSYLFARGIKIITRNYRDKCGEIDIIALDGDTYVFIEVKTRHNSSYGHPEEAVTIQKQRQIGRVALSYLTRYNLLDAPARFDVVTVMIDRGEPTINHIVSAFDVS